MLSNRFLEKDKKVQERWFRMKFYRLFGRQIKSLFLWRLHRKLVREFYIKDKVICKTLETTVKQYKGINEDLFPASKRFFNIALYFLLSERDVQALKADAFAHPNETKRNIALRALLLTIYEWDMGKVTGRRMQFIYESTGLSDSAKGKLVSALKSLKQARKAIENEMSEARHNTIAHREADAFRQHEIISQLNIMRFSLSLTKFYEASDALLKALVEAMLEIGTMKSLFHQVTFRENA